MSELNHRQLLLAKIRDERCDGNAAELARRIKKDSTYVNRLFYPASKKGAKGIGLEIMEACTAAFGLPPGYWDVAFEANSEVRIDAPGKGSEEASDGYVIKQYDTGGKMGHGLVLKDQPGVITSWTVNEEWMSKNVHRITSTQNLAIVTGFGDSMQPLYNPGDPLLVDRGITTVDFDGVYFFRVGEEGFIKRLQRIPGQGILVISDNTKYRDWTIAANSDFEVFGKVVKAWRGEDF